MDEQSITEEEGRVTWTLREKQRGEVKRVKQACKLKGGHTPRRNDTAAPRCLGWPRMASDSRSPAVRRDRGPVRRAPRPGKRGAAGKGAAPSPVTQRTFVGNLVLNHS
ncbi:uncharacterized protein LOC118356817 isoform X2 [Zalophus californianus]|uniref:Uncharacterized protein LOC118356817 isoform X2 n=1 Tax=Zalophus californianus TaxID=9704 RepID=A0A6P9FKB3_ZALCA|nr:uncharacterized protein LOC118356817 isoform X2 [Zalophus californianus]